MIKDDFFKIQEQIKELLDNDSTNYQIDRSKIQLYSQEGYSYLDGNIKDKYYRILCLLHGAIGLKKDKLNNSFLKYTTKNLNLLAGMFYYVNPISNNKNESYYLLGTEDKFKFGNNFKFAPKLNFKWFSYQKNFRGQFEYIPYKSNWLKFYFNINDYFIQNSFDSNKKVNGYHELFSRIGSSYRTNYEIKKNIFYISSGEIDLGIIFWLFLDIFTFKNKIHEINNIDYIFDFKIEIDLENIFNNSECDKVSNLIEINITKKSTKRIKEWLFLFGFIDENQYPTERLFTVMQYYYILLNTKENFTSVSKILIFEDLKFSKNTLSSRSFNDYCKEYLVNSTSTSTSTSNHKKTEELSIFFKNLMFSFFGDIIASCKNNFSKKKLNKSEIHKFFRFNIKSHFFQRCYIGVFDESFIETTCRGLVGMPILSNNDANLEKDKLPNLGYFYGLIKDSDPVGRNFLVCNNFFKDNPWKSDRITNEFNEKINVLQIFIHSLSKIETNNIYYNSIIKHSKDILQSQATRAAISQVMARNMSHNIGSHVMSKFKDIKDFNFDYNSNDNQYIDLNVK